MTNLGVMPMRLTKPSFLIFSVFIFLLFLIPAAPDTGVHAQDDDLQARVTKLFEERCIKCHGPDSFAAGGMDYILDTEQLIENELVKPGSPEESYLYEEVHEGEMPADGTAPLPDEDIELVAAWITSLDPDASAATQEETAAEPSESEETTESSGEGNRFLNWLGKFHPVIVHFPIALVLIAGFFELLSMAGGAFPFLPMENGRKGFATAARLSLFFGALFGLLSAWLGWLNAMDHFFAANLQDELFWHRWLGSGVAVLTFVAMIFGEMHHRAMARNEESGMAGMLYRLLLFASCLVIIFVGHLGGILVFGEGYYEF